MVSGVDGGPTWAVKPGDAKMRQAEVTQRKSVKEALSEVQTPNSAKSTDEGSEGPQRKARGREEGWPHGVARCRARLVRGQALVLHDQPAWDEWGAGRGASDSKRAEQGPEGVSGVTHLLFFLPQPMYTFCLM